MREPPIAPAAARNASAILGVLQHEFRNASSVLEIGSGTGQHAVQFAAGMPHLSWQASDLAGQQAGIAAHIALSGLANLPPPVELDVRIAALPGDVHYDAVFTCNTCHIMAQDAVERMIAIAGEALSPGGTFCSYGPFRRGGEFNTQSNAAFDASLRAQNPAMGIRDLETIDTIAENAGLSRSRIYAMPANNLLVAWEAHR